MLALRRRSKSRDRSRDHARPKKSKSHESGVPTMITIHNDNNDDDEGIIYPIQMRKKKRSKSFDAKPDDMSNDDFSTDDEMLIEYRKEGMDGMERRRSGTSILGLVSDDEITGGAERTRSAPNSLIQTSEHTLGTRSKTSAKKDRSNSLKVSRSFAESDCSQEVDETVEELHNEKTRAQLREELMKESMRAIERRQKQARKMISADEQKLRKDFDNILKQSIRQRVTRSKSDESNSKPNMLTSMSEHRGLAMDRRRKSASEFSNKKSLSSMDLSDDASFETELPLKFDEDAEENRKSSSRKKLNRPNSVKSTASLTVSSKSELSLGDKQNEKKGEIKKRSKSKDEDRGSNVLSPPALRKHKSERSKKKPSTPKNQKKHSTAETMDETSNYVTPSKSSQIYLQELEPETEQRTPNVSSWRKTVSNFITAGRSRSKDSAPGRSRSKDTSRSKSKDRADSKSRSKSRDRTITKSRSWGSRPSRKNSGIKTKSRSLSKADVNSKSSSEEFGIEDDGDLQWHEAIRKHEWDDLLTMLKSYDHTKYRQRSHDKGKPSGTQDQQDASPLLHVDRDGRTPLHLACKEQMPARLLRRLLFVERNAAFVQDADGRYPLHLAVIYNLDQHILDRVIHANSDSLVAADNMKRTPIQYAILKADRRRENKHVKWGPPKTEEEAETQKLLIEAYQPVVFILESMAKRGQVLSTSHEKKTLIEAVKNFAPPEVVDLMAILSEKILQKNQKVCEWLVYSVFEQNYPLNVIHRVLDIASKVIPSADLIETIRKRLSVHFSEGCHGDDSLAKQFAKTSRRGGKTTEKTSPVCKDWWEKLRYLIARSCNRTTNWKNDIVLHMALCNPKSKPALIEYLCRLNPPAKYKLDEVTGALPIHLACMHWHPDKHGIGDLRSQEKALNLLLAGDFDLVRKCSSDGRIALHYAILNGKPMHWIKTLLSLDQETISVRDPVTKLLPFQLAATSKKLDDENSTQHIDIIFNLLRASPF